MDPARKRKTRLVVALTAAVVLAGALIYTSFTAARDDQTAGQLLASARAGRSYQLAGTVTAARRRGDVLYFRVRDPRHADQTVLVRYTGQIPDPFRVGRGVVVAVRKQGAGFVGERGSLITKCPSKFRAKVRTS